MTDHIRISTYPGQVLGHRADGRPIYTIAGGAPDDGGGDGGNSGGGGGQDGGDGGQGGSDKTFTQADLDRVIAEKTSTHKAELDRVQKELRGLKEAADKGKTAEQQIADLQQQLAGTQRDALRSRVQAKFGISDEDADQFLIGDDKDTLEAQARRLKELLGSAKDRDDDGGGSNPRARGRNGRPRVTDDKKAVRTLFGTGG